MLEEPKGGAKKKTRTETNIGGVSNTTLEKSSESDTSQKTIVSGPITHQAAEEELIHQARE